MPRDDRGSIRARSRSRGRSRSFSHGRSRADRASINPEAFKTVKKARKEIFSQELGYKDESNPFGDNTLTQKFVWKKKNEYLQAAGIYQPSSKNQEVERISAKIREIHQVKKRRDEREVERQLLEQQRLQHDLEMHDEEYGEWLTKEEKFHLDNAKVRSKIRIEQGRERPIDLIAKSLAIADGEEFPEMTILEKPPYELFPTMSMDEAEAMVEDVETFLKVDKAHKGFWQAMLFISQDAVEAKRMEKGGAKSALGTTGLGSGVAECVVPDIYNLLAGQTREQLEEMLAEIKQQIRKGEEGTDPQFLDAVASKIPLFIARTEVENWHLRAKKKSDAWLQANGEDVDDVPVATAGGASSSTAPASAAASAGPASGIAGRPKGVQIGDWDEVPGGASPSGDEGFSPALEPLSALEEQQGRGGGAFSPVLDPLGGYNEEDLVDPDVDAKVQRAAREIIVEAFGGAPGAATNADEGLDRTAEDAMVEAERRRGMANGEASFNAGGVGTGDDFHGEVQLEKQTFQWEDKYKPRKPRFFNRVKTGYEWNKYNQTHYDHDNPPPKTVQGYKFNIFYPDLVDKTKAPTYHLEKSDTAETVTLRFHAGPPYEDVAFKIVNREWNLSHRFGFRCVFERGVLQLYFNLKRWRYRR